MFGFGNSADAAKWPFLKDAILFTPLALLVIGFALLIRRWWKNGHGG